MTHFKINHQSGFSLLELLIVGGLLALIFISVSGLMMSSLTGSIRTTLWQELRTEGSFATTQMAYLIRNANSILYEDYAVNSCDGQPQSYLQFDNPDDTKSVLEVARVDDQYILQLITINDTSSFDTLDNPTIIPLLPDSVQLTNQNIFTCSNAGERAYVKINLSLSKSSDTLGDLAQDFRKTIILRN